MQNDDDLPDHNTRNFVWLILGLAVAVTLCIACCGAGAWLAVDRIGDIPGLADFADAELPPPVVESAAEKRQWLRAAFTDPPPDGGFERRSLDVFFQRLVDASQADDDAPFQRLVDAERFWRSVKEGGLIKQLSRGEDRSIPALYLADLECPGSFERHFVQAITRAVHPNEAVAYVILWESGSPREYRWWLVRDGRVWKTYDWEPLQQGIRQSLRHAAYAADILGLNTYDAFWTSLEKVYAQQGEGKLFEATQELRSASSLKVPHIFEAEHKLHVADAFSHLNRPLREVEIYEAATPPQLQAAPGLLLGWALQAYENDDFEQALKLTEQYEKQIGGGPNVEQLRADCLVGLGRTAEAAQHYLHLLKYSPDDLYLQSEAARYLPADRFAPLMALLKKRPDPAEATYQAATHALGEPAVLDAYETLLTELAPDSPKLDIVRGMRLQAEGETDKAAETYLAAYQKAKQAESAGEADGKADAASATIESDGAGDEESELVASSLSDDVLSYFHELFWEADRPLESYDRSPDKRATFEYLVYQADEYGMSPERRRELVERHAKVAPDDPQVLAERAQRASDDGNHAEAVELWAQLVDAGEEYEYYRSSLAAELVELDRLDDALALVREHPNDLGVLSVVRAALQKAERYDELLAITELPRDQDLENNQTVSFAKADALTGLERFDDAEVVLKAQLEHAADDWQRSAVCREWLKIAEKAGWSAIRYLDVAGRDSMPTLIAVCQEKGDQRLEDLITDWQDRGGSVEAILPAQVELLARRKDFAAVVERVMEAGGATALASTENSKPLLHYVQSLLRSNHIERALDAAFLYYDVTGDASQLIIAHMIHDDWQAAEKLAALAADYTRQGLYLDDVALPLLRSDSAAQFRRRFPRGSGSLAQTLAVVLLPEPLLGTREEQLNQFRRAAGEIANAAVQPFESSDGTQLFLRGGDRGNWLIGWGADSYVVATEASLVENVELRKLLEPHRGWIAVDWVGRRSSDTESGWGELAEVVSKVAPTNASLLILQTSTGQFLCPFSPQLLEQMQTAGFSSAAIENREPSYLYREEELQPITRLSQTFPKLAEAFATRQEGDSFTVDAILSLPHSEVPVTLTVEGMILRPYTLELIANADSVPKPLQRLFPGNRLKIDGWSLTGWSYTKNGKQVRSVDLLAGSDQSSGGDTR